MRSRWRLLVALGLGAVSIAFAASLATSAYRYINVFQEVWGLTRQNYVEPVDENALLDGAFRGMLGSLDGASAYLAPGEERALAAPPGPGRPGMETLPSGGAPIVVRVDPNGPAARAGLDVGDQVWKIGGKSSRQLAWPQAKRRLAGAVGGKLDLEILDGRTFKLRDVTVDLDAPQGPGYLLDRREGPVTYVRLYDPDYVDVKQLGRDLAQKLAENRPAPVLVDLRGTVGLDPAVIGRIAGVFFTGPVLKLTPRSGGEETVNAESGGAPVQLQKPLYVLVDGTTVGAGEALAALLREKAGAVLCGRNTYGLGGVPEILPLPRGGTLLLTTREMRTPAGVHWSDKGLEPDKILAPQPGRTVAANEKRDTLLEDALKFVRNGNNRAS